VLQVIDAYAPFQVASAINGEAIEPGHIYVSAHGKHLSIGRPGIVRIEEPSFFDNVHPSINRLFSAAAVVYGSRVIAVVLSGNQYDGVQGLRDVAAAGGVSIVQDPEDASAPQMPRHVINNDHPRYTREVVRITHLVRRLIAGEA
jgi:two-component system chemotaxis response regulator CheB